MSGGGSSSPASSAPRRRRLAVLLLALLGGPLLAEGLLRWLLFSPSSLAERLGARFRAPGLYLASSDSEDHAKLAFLFRVGWRLHPGTPACADAELGWIKPALDAASYRHEAEGALGERRVVLLYGSSFASCYDNQEPCFQELLDGSELGRTYGLLNYAVSGYGLDQCLLLLRKSVDAYAARAPVVVLGFVAEGDLERTTLSFLSRPKPRFRARGDGFVLEPPDELDLCAYLERHPPSIHSYLLRYLANGAGLLPLETRERWEGEPELREERRSLNAYLLREFERECARRGLEHFALLFHREAALAAPVSSSGDEVHALLADARLPWVDSRADVERALAKEGASLAQLYGTTGHPTGLGTAVVFEALARGLRCERDGGKR